MRFSIIALAAVAGLASCAGKPIKPAEVLDERTGMTVGALQNPIEFVENAQYAVLAGGKRTSFAYLGPVEWDTSGELTYALWVHVAPGNDTPVGDIHAHGAVAVALDDGVIPLLVSDVPTEGVGPYRPIASWGQTAYFNIDIRVLKRMAASRKLTLQFQAVDQSMIEFTPSLDPRVTLTQFLQARGVTLD